MRHAARTALLFVAMLALSGLAASAASAAGQYEWLEKTHGSFYQIVTPLTVKPTATITINDTTGFLKMTCQVEIEGALEAGGVGKISSFKPHNCVGERSCVTPQSASAEHLPWKTELYAYGTEVRQRIVSGGSGTPSLWFECKGPVGNLEDRCNLDTNAKVSNVEQGANAKFDATSNKTTCTHSTEGPAGEITGSISYPHPTGTEAIEVRSIESKAGTWKQAGVAITSPVAIKWAGKLALTDKANNIESECEATGEGVAEPGHVGKETKWTLTGCKVIKGSSICESAEAEAVNLPWHLELADNVSKREVITSGGSGEPGFKNTCQTVFGKVSDVITGKKLEMSLEDVSGGVSSTFIWPGEWLTCTQGKEGIVEGTQLVEAVSGGTLEVS